MNSEPNERWEALITPRKVCAGDPGKSWNVLTTLDARPNPAACGVMFQVMLEAEGRDAVEQKITEGWPLLSENARRNISYAAHRADGPSTRLLEAVFNHPSSTVGDRHRLLAAIAVRVTDSRGDIQALDDADVARKFARNVGRYGSEQPRRQEALTRLVESIDREFSVSPACTCWGSNAIGHTDADCPLSEE